MQLTFWNCQGPRLATMAKHAANFCKIAHIFVTQQQSIIETCALHIWTCVNLGKHFLDIEGVQK